MDSAKINIRTVVETYTKVAPEEYAAFKVQMGGVRRALTDQKFGTLSDKEGMRALFETPINLHEMLVNNLTVDQLEWFKSKEGGRWFANAFPEFRIPALV